MMTEKASFLQYSNVTRLAGVVNPCFHAEVCIEMEEWCEKNCIEDFYIETITLQHFDCIQDMKKFSEWCIGEKPFTSYVY